MTVDDDISKNTKPRRLRRRSCAFSRPAMTRSSSAIVNMTPVQQRPSGASAAAPAHYGSRMVTHLLCPVLPQRVSYATSGRSTRAQSLLATQHRWLTIDDGPGTPTFTLPTCLDRHTRQQLTRKITLSSSTHPVVWMTKLQIVRCRFQTTRECPNIRQFCGRKRLSVSGAVCGS